MATLDAIPLPIAVPAYPPSFLPMLMRMGMCLSVIMTCSCRDQSADEDVFERGSRGEMFSLMHLTGMFDGRRGYRGEDAEEGHELLSSIMKSAVESWKLTSLGVVKKNGGELNQSRVHLHRERSQFHLTPEAPRKFHFQNVHLQLHHHIKSPKNPNTSRIELKMGRHSFAAQNINKSTQSLLNTKRLPHPPPAFIPLATFPPSTRLVRPPKQRSAKPGSRRTSRLFAPLNIAYQEDRLRWEYFNDHPWELARPRVMLESDGRDHERWDWSLPLDFGLLRPVVRKGEVGVWDRLHARQSGRPLNGEA